MLQVQSRYQAPNFSSTGIETVDEIIFAQPEDILKQGCQVKAGTPHIRVGDALGRITASGLYRRVTNLKIKTQVEINGTEIIITDVNGVAIESPFLPGEILRVGTTGGDGEDVTVSGATNATGKIIVPALSKQHLVDAPVTLKTADGSEKIVGFAGHPLQSALYRQDKPEVGYLLDTDYDVEIFLAGCFVKSKLKGILSVAQAAIDLGSFIDLSPAFDAVIVR